MELRQLELFLAVAEEGQFTRAARRCHIAQSALSTAIRVLERDLGSPLFNRTTRQVELTEAGRALIPEARRTLSAATTARQAVAGVQQLVRGSIAVGGIRAAGLIDLAALLAEFRSRYPEIEIHYVVGASSALVQEVKQGGIDIAFVTLPASLPSGIQALDIVTERLMFVCRPDHRLAERRTVSLRALAKEPFVSGPRDSAGAQAIERVFTAANLERNVPFEVNDSLTMLEFVAHGLGVTLLNETAARGRPDLRAIPLNDPALSWTMVVIAPSAGRVTPAARALLDLLSERPWR